MNHLHYEWISGTVPKNVLSENEKNFITFAATGTDDDGFVHLLGKGTHTFPTSCLLTFHIEAAYQFLYVYEGTLVISGRHHSHRLSGGCAALLETSGTTTVSIEKGRCRYFQMYLSGLALSHFHALLPTVLSYPTESSSLFAILPTIGHLQDLQADATDDPLFLCRTSLWITGILTEMTIYASQPLKKRDAVPEYLKEIHHLFETEYTENYTLDGLENTYSVSKYRICREFSKYYGASPVQYLNHRRIEEAKKLLLTTNATIHEVGSMVGIHNTNHFINLFKRETGATPLVFKQDAPVSISELHYL